MRWWFSFLTFLMTISFFSMEAEEPAAILKEKMLVDLHYHQSLFESRYAPADWKRNFAHWSIREEVAKAKERILSLESPTIKDYQAILADVYNSTLDYHVRVEFYSTEKAYLPFALQEAEGRYFIVSIDRKQLPLNVFPFKVGDELLFFDGQPIAEAVADLERRMRAGGAANPKTDHALAVRTFTNRRGERGLPVPKGPVFIEGKSREGRSIALQTLWFYSEELIRGSKDSSLSEKPSFLESLSNLKMVASDDLTKTSFSSDNGEDGSHEIGAKRSPLPRLGEVLWMNDPSFGFDAYLSKDEEGNKIGYVRISSYTSMATLSGIEEFAGLMRFFEKNADLLVIDQLNNPGGYVFFSYALLSMLTDKPLKTPRHRWAITQEDVKSALDFIESYGHSDFSALFDGSNFGVGYPIDLNFAYFSYAYAKFIVNQWNNGQRLTDSYFVAGADAINPSSKVNFTKPILFLINELDFSGGDFTPAVLQDNGRAILMGERTAGAGGVVVGSTYPNDLGVSLVRHTVSLAERADGSMIENLGVSPDIPYEVTAEDVQNGYQGYAKAILDVIKNMLNGHH